MKRSEINAILAEAEDFLREQRFFLPPFAAWGPDDWAGMGEEAREIVDNQLGWDITDFGTGDFGQCGLALFTLRNGSVANVKSGTGKTYCEKIAVMRQDQRCPMHHHFVKVEDIINRGTAPLAITLQEADGDGRPSDQPVTVSMDGVRRTVKAGDTVVLRAGESITLLPGCYHALWAPEGEVMFGEVSVVNDDHADNRFLQPVGRFPEIDEDEAPRRLLVQDYGRYWRA
ncbi:MAG: D-lyxose/D-mannose family sugar isomerase [Alphaproteobacteria bacterium]